MNTICARNLSYPVSLCSTKRASGPVPPVNAAAKTGERPRPAIQRQARKSTGRRSTDQVFRDHAPAPVLAFQTTGEVIVGLSKLGEQERQRSRPGPHEVACRYEDRLFEPIEAGTLRRKYA